MNYIPDEDNHQHSKRIASRIKMRLRLADYFNRKNSVGPVPVTQLTQDDSASETPTLPPFPFVSSRPDSDTSVDNVEDIAIVCTLFTGTQNQSKLTLEHSTSSSSTSSSSRPTRRDYITTEAKKKRSKNTKSTPIKSTKSAPWMARLPEAIEMSCKRTHAVKTACQVDTSTTKTKKRVKVGSLVHKKLKIQAYDLDRPNKSRWQKAIVFGTVKERVKRGRWLVKFENNQHLTLKPNEFFLISEDKNQQVITFNSLNEIIIKDPKTDIIDLTIERSKMVDLTGTQMVDLTDGSDETSNGEENKPYTK